MLNRMLEYACLATRGMELTTGLSLSNHSCRTSNGSLSCKKRLSVLWKEVVLVSFSDENVKIDVLKLTFNASVATTGSAG